MGFLPDLPLLPVLSALEVGFVVAAGLFLCADEVAVVWASPAAILHPNCVVIVSRAQATAVIRTVFQPLNFVSFLSQPTPPL
jgi:hypothetical protein